MTIKQLLRYCLLLLLVLLIGAYFFVGGDHSAWLIVISVIYFLFLFFILELAKDKYIKPLLYLLVIHSILWIGIRLVYLNYNMATPPYGDLVGVAVNSTDLSFTILMSLVSTLCLALGIKTGSMVKTNKRYGITVQGDTAYHSTIRETFLFIYVPFILLMTVLKMVLLHANPDSYWLQIFGVLVSYDPLIILFVSYGVCYWQGFTIQKKMWVLMVGFIFIGVRTLGGSKGGIFWIGTVVLTVLMALRPTIRIPSRVLVYCALLIPLSFLFYFIGYGLTQVKSAYASESLTVSFYAQHLPKVFQYSLSNFSLNAIAAHISQRLSMLEYLNVMFNYKPLNNYLGLGYSLKMIWNTIIPHYLLPSLYFEEAKVFPANLFRVAYGVASYEHAVKYYHSDMLPLFGYLYLNLWSGSFFVLYFFGLGVSFLYKWLYRSSINSLYFYNTLYLYYFAQVVFGMGFANTYIELQDNVLIPLLLFFFFHWVLSRRFWCISGRNKTRNNRVGLIESTQIGIKQTDWS